MGNWGEMHGSRFLRQEYLEQMADMLRRYQGEGTFLAVRRPAYWRALHVEDHGTDMGLFDDGIFGSASDLGTFGAGSEKTEGWCASWSREEELCFERELCKRVPHGGEVVYGEGYSRNLGQKQILEDLGRMHITYLNSRHDARLLACWEEGVYEGAGVWKGCSLYDYIGAHLGYRFLIRKAAVHAVKGQAGEQQYCIAITIENTGFASLYQEAELYLECEDQEGNKKRIGIDCDMRLWESGGIYQIESMVEVEKGELYLSAGLKRNGRSIYFANQSDEAGRVYLGSLVQRR